MGKAEVLNKAENQFLRTVNHLWAMPSVIRLFSYVNIPYKGVMLNRHNIFRRDGNRCVYCSAREDLTLDHVMPRSRGGKTSWTNLVTACKRCNARKGDFTPEEANMPLPYAPFKPSFVVFLREFVGVNDEAWKQYLHTQHEQDAKGA